MSALRPSPAGSPGIARDVVLAALGTLLVYAVAHAHALTSWYVAANDVRQQLFWMYSWRDPSLMQPDLLVDYGRNYVPWGVRAIYWLGVQTMDPLWFSKLLTGVLFMGTGVGAYLAGRKMGGRVSGLACLAVFWCMPFFLYRISGGLSRGFGPPLMVMFWAGWAWNKPRVIAAALFLQAVCIPYIFMVCALAAGMAWAGSLVRLAPRPAFPSRIWHFAVLALSAALVLLLSASFDRAGFGPLATQQDMAGQAEFGPDGRYPIVNAPSLAYELVATPFERIAPFHENKVALGVALLLALIAACALGLRRADRRQALLAHAQPALWIWAASLLLYAAAEVLLFRLFVPARYVTYTVNVSLCLAMGFALSGLFAGGRMNRGLAALLLAVAALLGGMRAAGTGVDDYTNEAFLFQAVRERVAPDEMVAGNPYRMDNVLTFGRRRVFASYELAHPWSLGLWEILGPRLDHFFTAYYSDDPAEVLAFCRDNDIDWLLVARDDFSPEFIAQGVFFAPYADQVRALARGRSHFGALDLVGPQYAAGDHVWLVPVRRVGP